MSFHGEVGGAVDGDAAGYGFVTIGGVGAGDAAGVEGVEVEGGGGGVGEGEDGGVEGAAGGDDAVVGFGVGDYAALFVAGALVFDGYAVEVEVVVDA